jgi:transposase InsO family protein
VFYNRQRPHSSLDYQNPAQAWNARGIEEHQEADQAA